MMPALECRHVLATGQKCRGAALRNQTLCRHHAPKSAAPGPPPLSKRARFSPLARWRSLGQRAPWLSPADIPGEVLDILYCLLSTDETDSISDLSAGRYLRALLRRLGRIPFALPDPDSGLAEDTFPYQPAQPANTAAGDRLRTLLDQGIVNLAPHQFPASASKGFRP